MKTRNRTRENYPPFLRSVTHFTSLFQLLWHWIVTKNVWLIDNEELPRVSLVEVPASIRKAAAWIYVSSIVLGMMAISMAIFQCGALGISIKRARNVVPKFLVPKVLSLAMVLSFIVQACGDVVQVQPPVLHGLALLFCDEPFGAQVVLSGTWLWSGLHKINPNFLRSPNSVIDPVFAWMLPFVDGRVLGEWRVVLHGLVATTEALAGAILLFASCKRQGCKTLSLKIMVRIAMIFLACMHAIITVRLIQMKWNYSVIGWNLNCAFLLIAHWYKPWWQSTIQSPEAAKSNGGGKSPRTIMALVFFVLSPFLVSVGWLDPYLGMSLYSDNIPSLNLELPTNITPPLEKLYRSWGLYEGGNDDETKVITSISYVKLQMRVTKGSVGYPALWHFQRFVAVMCDTLGDSASEARFRLQHAYTGRTLWNSLLVIGRREDPITIVPPPTSLNEGCSPTWHLVDPPSEEDRYWEEPSPNREPVLVRFSVTNRLFRKTSVDLYWIKGLEPTVVDNDATMWKAELVRQGKMLVQTFVGDKFVATAKREEDGSLCALEIFSAIQGEDEGHRQQQLNRTVPGLELCLPGDKLKQTVVEEEPMLEEPLLEEPLFEEEEVSIDFSMAEGSSFESETIGIYWVSVDNFEPADDTTAPKSRAKLVYQGEISVETSITINSFAGHRFVAAATTGREDGSLCSLEVWQVNDTDDDQQFVFNEISSTTVPGLPSCWTGEEDDAYSTTNEKETTTMDEALIGQNEEL